VPPVHNTGHSFSTDPYRPGVSRPVKSCSTGTVVEQIASFAVVMNAINVEDNAELVVVSGTIIIILL